MMITLKKLLPVIVVLAFLAGTMPLVSATSSLSIDSLSHDSSVVKQESFTVSSAITASNVASTITVTATLMDTTGGAVTIIDAEKTLTFTTNATKNVQWSVTAGTAGTYSNPFQVTATASDGGSATPKTSDTSLTIQERPVLEVTFTSNETSVSAGDTVRLNLTIMNSAAADAADATNVNATLALPDGWSVATGPSYYSFGTIAAGGGSQSGYWIVSADNPSTSNTLTLNVQSTLPGGTITKTVTIAGPIQTTPTPTPTPQKSGGGGGDSSANLDSDGDSFLDTYENIAGSDPLDPCDPDPDCSACLNTQEPTGDGTNNYLENIDTTATQKSGSTPEVSPATSTTPTPVATPELAFWQIPGFEALFAVAGLLSIAYLLQRRRR